MKILLIALIISILFLGFSLPFMFRSFARFIADKITFHHRPTTENHINMYISILTWSNKWITNREEPDLKRINRLNLMLDKIQKPQV